MTRPPQRTRARPASAKRAATTPGAATPSTGRQSAKTNTTAAPRIAGVILGARVRRIDWLPRFTAAAAATFVPGTPAPSKIRVPAGDAQRVLRSTVRFVADIAADSPPSVVWVQGEHELLVHTDEITLSCASGLVTITLAVECDQVPKDVVTIPFAVGTAQLPSGLVMATFTRPTGPGAVVDAWAEALTAFAWEALIHLAQALCAECGRDSAGRPLVPAYIGAGANVLLIQPIARHEFSGRRL